jgi:hypothetical protein
MLLTVGKIEMQGRVFALVLPLHLEFLGSLRPTTVSLHFFAAHCPAPEKQMPAAAGRGGTKWKP